MHATISVYVCDAVRTPFGRYGGVFSSVRPDDLAAHAIRALVGRAPQLDPAAVEEVFLGCANQAGEDNRNVARMASLLAGLPESVPGATINRLCGSGLDAVALGARTIASGDAEIVIAGGVESMTRVPMMGFNPMPNPVLQAKVAAYISMGDTAENVASRWHLSREEQEAFAVRSQQRAAAAAKAGHFKDEIVPIAANGGSVDAGTSSPLTDGASAVLVCSEDYASKNGLTPLARIRSVAVAGCAPDVMGIGPVGATQKALLRAKLEMSAIDVVELNEAFASQALACVRDLGIRDETLNIDGGAIALGHPLGATGARIVGKAASLLKRSGGRYALATQCIGGGQGIATILERI